jgi:hypothetical protein
MMTTSMCRSMKDWEKKVDPNTNLWDRLPLEVKDIIFMFESGMNFREKMDLTQIHVDAVRASLFRHVTANTAHYAETGMFMIPWSHTLCPGEAEHFVEICSKCTCCDVHQKRRPTTLDYLNGFAPPPKIQIQNEIEKPCKCYCRTLIRQICQEINDDYHDLPALIDDDEESDDDEYYDGWFM